MENVASQPTISDNILEILQKKGKIDADDLSILETKYKNDPEGLEKALLQKRFVTQEDVAKAYAVFFNLPFINLKDTDIPYEVINRVPEKLARTYLIVSYQAIGRILKIAVAQPWRLSKGQGGVLAGLRKNKKIHVQLAITTLDDLIEALKLYGQKPPKVQEQPTRQKEIKPPVAPIAPKPVKINYQKITLKNLQLTPAILNKFPQEIAQKYRMVVFDVPTYNHIRVAAENPDDPKIAEIVSFIKKANDIKIDLCQTSKEDIDFALKQYFAKPTAMPKPVIQPVQPPVKPAAPKVLPVTPPQAPPKPSGQKEEEKEGETPEVSFNELQNKEKTETTNLTDEFGTEDKDLNKFLGQPVTTVKQLEDIVKSGMVPKIVAAILTLAAEREASDVHLEPSEKNFRVRYRIDGVLQDILIMPLSLQPSVISRVKILSRLKIDETRIPQDGRFDILVGTHAIDLRVATLPTVHGEKVAIRLLDKTSGIMSLEQLGLMGKGFDILMLNIQKPYGIILSTGPTGSGKTTTLYAILNRLNQPNVNIVTLEDPVEYEIPGLNQCQIKPKIGFTFAEGLRSVVRQDPNIIMVGEIRDAETASMATHAALTGHLVLSTLHTNDSASALPRLINMGIEPFLITSSLNVIIAQRLVRKLCPTCKKEFVLPPAVKVKVQKELDKIKNNDPLKFFKPVGCDKCNHGYKGRVGIYEVLPMTDKIENLAVAKYPASKIKDAAVAEGMVTMIQDGILKALKGMTSIDEVFRVISD